MPESESHPTVAPSTLGHLLISASAIAYENWLDETAADPACRMVVATASELLSSLVANNPQRAADLADRLEDLRATL
jgi:hypothetical protein